MANFIGDSQHFQSKNKNIRSSRMRSESDRSRIMQLSHMVHPNFRKTIGERMFAWQSSLRIFDFRGPKEFQNDSLSQEAVRRIKKRKALYSQRKLISILSMLVGLVGLIIGIVLKELKLLLRYDEIIFSAAMAALIISSVILAGLLIWYRLIVIQIRMIEKGLECWKSAITRSDCLKIVAEIILANVHPYFFHMEIARQVGEELGGFETFASPFLFTILMSTRLFLVMRMILVHHRFIDGKYAGVFRYIPTMKVNYSFGLRVLLNEYPWRLLVSMIFLVLLMGSWSMRACEASRDDISLFKDLLDRFWLVAITYLTVGFVLSLLTDSITHPPPQGVRGTAARAGNEA